MDNNNFKRCLEFYENPMKTTTWNDLAKELNYSSGEQLRSQFRREYKKMAQSSGKITELNGSKEIPPFINNSQKPFKETFELKSDGSIISEKIIKAFLEDMKDPASLMRLHGIDPEKFELVSYRSNVWQANSGDGNSMPLVQSKIVVKPITNIVNENVIKATFKELSLKSPPLLIKTVTAEYHDSQNNPERNLYEVKSKERNKIAILSIYDLHYNKLVLSPTGKRTYDTDIAEKRFKYTLKRFLEHLYPYHDNLGGIVFCWSQDFFNSDGIAGTTTKGTPQTNELPWNYAFQKGCKLLVEAINMINSTFANDVQVYTFYVPSNHDKAVGFYANEFLSAFYEKSTTVHIDTRYAVRKYFSFGQNLFGFSHGDNDGKRLGTMMPIEWPQGWGNTKYHTFFAGHLHSEQVTVEKNGVIVRRLSSPVAPDEWHQENGFVGAEQSSQTFLYDGDKGLEEIFYVNIPDDL